MPKRFADAAYGSLEECTAVAPHGPVVDCCPENVSNPQCFYTVMQLWHISAPEKLQQSAIFLQKNVQCAVQANALVQATELPHFLSNVDKIVHALLIAPKSGSEFGGNKCISSTATGWRLAPPEPLKSLPRIHILNKMNQCLHYLRAINTSYAIQIYK